MKKELIALNNSGKTVHAFAFIGGSKESRLELGTFFARTLLCEDPVNGFCGKCLACRKSEHGNHEDYIVVRKPEDRESIVKDQILQLIDRLSFKPYGSRYVVLIEDADLMNAASQNKLLKTLEEPQSQAVIILLSPTKDALLPTVLSRCRTCFLEEPSQALTEDLKQASREFLKLILSNGSYYRKKALIQPFTEDKDDSRGLALAFLDALELVCRDVLVNSAAGEGRLSEAQKQKITDAVRQVEISRKYLKQLHSTAYTLKQMCLRV